MFKKTLYVLFVLVLLTGCIPVEITNICTLSNQAVNLISYQKTEDNKLSLIMRERDSGSLVAVTTTIFMYIPLTVKNGVTSPDSSTDTLTYFDDSRATGLPDGKVYFPQNSSGTVYCHVGDGFSVISVIGLFNPTEKDLYIQGLVNTYYANRSTKAEMLGARALHDTSLVDPPDPLNENHFLSVFEISKGDMFFPIPESQCWALIQAYKEWGTDWKQYVALRQMCGFTDSPVLSLGYNDPYAGLAIDDTTFGNKSMGDFNRYYSYAAGMLPSVFEPLYAWGEICPGGQVDLPNGMTGTAYENDGWADYDGGFAFDHGIEFVVSYGGQHFFIPYGGYFVVTDSAHTPDEYALYTTCSEK